MQIYVLFLIKTVRKVGDLLTKLTLRTVRKVGSLRILYFFIHLLITASVKLFFRFVCLVYDFVAIAVASSMKQ